MGKSPPNRIRELRQDRGLTLEQLADRAGTTHQTVQRLETGARKLTQQWMERLSQALNVSPAEFLAAPATNLERRQEAIIAERLRAEGYKVTQSPSPRPGQPTPDLIAQKEGAPDLLIEVNGHSIAVLPRYDIEATAGDGAEPFEHAEPMGFQPFEHQWLRGITRAPLEKLSLIRVSGDSMWETLHEGDQILVDRTKVKPTRDGLYVIRVEDDLMVKRIQVDLEKKRLNVISDNPRYPMQSVEPEQIAVLGRVVWIGRRV